MKTILQNILFASIHAEQGGLCVHWEKGTIVVVVVVVDSSSSSKIRINMILCNSFANAAVVFVDL